MVADLTTESRGAAPGTARPVTEPAGGAAPGAGIGDLLGRLEIGPIGRRGPGTAAGVRRGEPAGCFLYGPYVHLPAGRYRLEFRCRCARPRHAALPALGVDILVVNRFQLGWRDFTAAELAAGSGTLDFVVPPEHSLEGENEGRFEFRFFHLGTADLSVTAVALTRLPSGAPAPASRWRLLARLTKSWRGRRRRDGSLAVGRRTPAGCLVYGGWPYLRLPQGDYRLLVQVRCGVPREPGRPVLGIAVLGASRWLGRPIAQYLLRRPQGGGVTLAQREVDAAALAAGPVAVEVSVPSELSLEAGADAPVDIRLYHRGNAALTVESVELVRLGAVASRPIAAPRLRPSGRRKLVIVGNCQSETLRQGFVRIEALNRRFDARYHFVQLPKNLHEFAARDLETCDVLLIQDIRLWDEFPLRDAVRPGAEVRRFPLVRFTSLWPFDGWNGPGDSEAYAREAPNLTFPYLDGLLGRLRRDIPDPEARFAAYRSLELPGIVNYRRLHDLEARRLAGVDKAFGISMGSFILDNFRSRRLFHTTVRPNWEVFSLLMQCVAALVGVREPITLGESVDASLHNPQVPIHPKVARDLGVRWVDEGTRYLVHGHEVTWEAYIRRYIEHYG